MKEREHFGSRRAVIYAMAGSAIGLGNIWRFPYMVGEHGGAVFVFSYIVATLLVSLPVFIAEISLGRRSRTSSFGAMSRMDPAHGRRWRWVGLMSVFIPLFILCYYSVIGGWSLYYLIKSCAFDFVKGSPDTVGNLFGGFISSVWMPVWMHLLFLAACAWVVARGVKSGIERFSRVTIPGLFVLIIVLIVYSVSLPGARAGVEYLLRPDLSQLNVKTFVYAMGQSFFSLSLGMGAIVTYGSYVKSDENLVVSSAGTAIFDLLFAVLAGFAIMPAVFAAGIEPGAGPGLIFESVPFIFSSMGTKWPVVSAIVSVLFFLAIVVAAMTSVISLIEVGVAFLHDRFGMDRRRASALVFLVCGAVGVVCSLSFGPLSGFRLAGKNLFELFDWFSSNVLLLLMAFTVVIFVGFVMKKEDVRDEITNGGRKQRNARWFGVIYFLIKWVAPISVLSIFVTNFIL
ncbi:MAG: sodium-dependent transporter [Bacteroidales bacterium]|nr:sodium-dependent transporter [Bacteroidales bacterium]